MIHMHFVLHGLGCTRVRQGLVVEADRSVDLVAQSYCGIRSQQTISVK